MILVINVWCEFKQSLNEVISSVKLSLFLRVNEDEIRQENMTEFSPWKDSVICDCGVERKKKERKKRKVHNGRRWSPSVRMHISVLCIQTGRPIFWTRETKEKEGGK